MKRFKTANDEGEWQPWDRKAELDTINSLTNPNYEDGTHDVWIRYPHAGIVDIPELVVRNKRSNRRNF